MSKSDFTACIPNRGSTLGLWATICSLEEAAKYIGATIDYAVCVNGREEDEPLYNLQGWLLNRMTTKLMFAIVPPPLARNEAASIARGQNLIFVDDHVIVPHDWLDWMRPDMGIKYSSYKTNQYRYYHFVPDKDLPTKGDYSREPLSSHAYPCLSAPSGGFTMTRDTWNELGGYENWYETFGGEETDLGFKAQAKDIPVYMVPQAYYYHYSVRSDVRGYDKTIDQQNYERLWNALGRPQPRERAPA